MDDNDLYLILNDGTGTRISFCRNQTPLDITFVSNKLANISNWNDSLGGDQLLIKIRLYQSNKIIGDNTWKNNSWKKKMKFIQ